MQTKDNKIRIASRGAEEMKGWCDFQFSNGACKQKSIVKLKIGSERFEFCKLHLKDLIKELKELGIGMLP